MPNSTYLSSPMTNCKIFFGIQIYSSNGYYFWWNQIWLNFFNITKDLFHNVKGSEILFKCNNPMPSKLVRAIVKAIQYQFGRSPAHFAFFVFSSISNKFQLLKNWFDYSVCILSDISNKQNLAFYNRFIKKEKKSKKICLHCNGTVLNQGMIHSRNFKNRLLHPCLF